MDSFSRLNRDRYDNNSFQEQYQGESIFDTMIKFRQLFTILLSGLVISGSAQDIVVTTDKMNHAILERADAVESAATGDLIRAWELLVSARKLDPYQLETIFLQKILDDFNAGLIGRSLCIRIFSAIETLYSQRKDAINGSVSVQQSEELNYNPGRLILGRMLAMNSMPEGALREYNMVSTNEPGLPLTYLWRAELLQEQGKLDSACRDLETCLEIVPDNYQVNYALGRIWLTKRDYAKAVYFFEKVQKIHPEYAYFLQPNLDICAAYNGRGQTAMRRGDLAGALSDFNRAIQLNPRFGEFYLNRGIIYRRLGNINAALRDFDRAVILDGKYVEAYFNRGLLFTQIQYYSQALRDLTRVIELDKYHVSARYQIGMINMEQRAYHASVTAFDSLLMYQPDHYRAIYAKAVALDELKHYRQAAEAYERFFEMAPDTLYDHKLKAWERSRLIRKVLREKYGEE